MQRLESFSIWVLIALIAMGVAAVLPFYFVSAYVALIMEPRDA